jgi:hypothetical protein
LGAVAVIVAVDIAVATALLVLRPVTAASNVFVRHAADPSATSARLHLDLLAKLPVLCIHLISVSDGCEHVTRNA